jgi:octaprenyl-diphosphate synthase
MVSVLDLIKAPINDELEAFEKHFKDSMKSANPFLDKITYYIVQKRGKQVRPILVFLSAKLCGGINNSTYVAASLVEILHTATLVHDDVVDDSYQRRGVFSINALWKNKIAVLVGDYLFARSFIMALDNKSYNHLHTLSNAITQMSEGELLQIEKARKLDINESVYFEIIRQKTASLIAAACSSGASSATDNKDMSDLFWKFGEKIGTAFQIKDDLLDYGVDDIDKPKGIDIKEKKMTLPLIHALSKAPKSEKNHIINMVKRADTNSSSVKEVLDFVNTYGGIEYAQKMMGEYKLQAKEMLNVFEPSPAKEAMHMLLDFFTDRKK